MKDVSELIASANINIISMVLETEDSFVHNSLVVEVKNLNQLNRLMNKLRDIEGIISVERENGETN